MLLEAAFFSIAFLLVYHYVLYPAGVVGLAFFRSPKAGPCTELPTVSLIVAAYNEEAVIEGKIINSLALDYPQDLLQIIVVSDGSDDATPEIVRRFEEQRVISLHEAGRNGKSAALNRAVAFATGDIVLFSDANNMFNDSAIRHMVGHFDTPEVGAVCGVKTIDSGADRESAVGDGAYWVYESAIKMAESKLHTITCADGEMVAMRRSLYQPIPKQVINDDLEITLDLIARGYLLRYEPRAISSEAASASLEDDFAVKVRMVAGGYQALSQHFSQLIRPSWFNLMFWSHKVLRWLAPVLLIVLLGVNIVLLDTGRWFYVLCFAGQVAFYALALWGVFGARDRTSLGLAVYVPTYFTMMNSAAFVGLAKFALGRQSVNWKKAKR